VRVRRLSRAILAFSSELYWNLTQNSVLRFADVWVFGIAFFWLRQPHSGTKISDFLIGQTVHGRTADIQESAQCVPPLFSTYARIAWASRQPS
jgi:hypothetical protein